MPSHVHSIGELFPANSTNSSPSRLFFRSNDNRFLIEFAEFSADEFFFDILCDGVSVNYECWIGDNLPITEINKKRTLTPTPVKLMDPGADLRVRLIISAIGSGSNSDSCKYGWISYQYQYLVT